MTTTKRTPSVFCSASVEKSDRNIVYNFDNGHKLSILWAQGLYGGCDDKGKPLTYDITLTHPDGHSEVKYGLSWFDLWFLLVSIDLELTDSNND